MSINNAFSSVGGGGGGDSLETVSQVTSSSGFVFPNFVPDPIAPTSDAQSTFSVELDVKRGKGSAIPSDGLAFSPQDDRLYTVFDITYTIEMDVSDSSVQDAINRGDDYVGDMNVFVDTFTEAGNSMRDVMSGIKSSIQDQLVSFVANRTDMPAYAVEQMMGNAGSIDPSLNRFSAFGSNIGGGLSLGSASDGRKNSVGNWEWDDTRRVVVPAINIPYHPSMDVGDFFDQGIISQIDGEVDAGLSFNLHMSHGIVPGTASVIHNTSDFPVNTIIHIDPSWFIEYNNVGDQYCFMTLGQDWKDVNTLTGRLETLINGVPSGVTPGPGAEIPTTVGQAESDIADVRSILANNLKSITDQIKNAESLRELAPNPSQISIPEVDPSIDDAASSIQQGEIPDVVSSVEQQIQSVREQVDQAISDLSTGEMIDVAEKEHISAIADQNQIQNWVSKIEDAVDSLQSAQEYKNQLQDAVDGLQGSAGLSTCINQALQRAQDILDSLGQEVPDLPGVLSDGEQLLNLLGGELPAPPQPPEPPIDCMEEYPDISPTIENLQDAPERIRDRQVRRKDILNTITQTKDTIEQSVQENKCVQQFTGDINQIESEVREIDPWVVCKEKYSDLYSRVEEFEGAAERIESGQVARADIIQQLSELRGRVGEEVEEPRCGSKIRARIDDAEASIADADLVCGEAYAGLSSRISNFRSSVDQFVSFNPVQRSERRRQTLISEGRSLLDEIDSNEIQSPCDSRFRSRTRDALSSLQGLRVISRRRLPCSARFKDIDKRVSEIERISENISSNSPEQDIEAILTRVESLKSDIRQVEDKECVEKFTRRVAIATRDVQSLGQSIRVDENIVNELQARRTEMIEDFQARYDSL